jgi:hypothetical protein
MINDSIARKRSVDEQRLTERFCEGPTDVWFAAAFERETTNIRAWFSSTKRSAAGGSKTTDFRLCFFISPVEAIVLS